MFLAVVILGGVGLAVVRDEGGRDVQDGGGGRPRVGPGGVEGLGVDERLEGRTGLAGRGRHVERAVDGGVEEIGAADQRQDLPGVRVERHQRGVVDVVADRAGLGHEPGQVAGHDLLRPDAGRPGSSVVRTTRLWRGSSWPAANSSSSWSLTIQTKCGASMG